MTVRPDKVRQIREAIEANPDKLRELFESDPALARRFGYVPQQVGAVRPEVVVGRATSAQRRAELEAAGFTLTDMDQPTAPRIVTDEHTGRRQYVPGRNVYAAAASLPAGGPPVTLEIPPADYFRGAREPIDRFALNPAVTYFRSQLPTESFSEPTPTMFAFGRDLPLATASGLPVDLLRWCPWYLRHAAHLAESARTVLLIIEQSGDIPDVNNLQTQAGADQLGEYFARVWAWAAQSPTAAPDDLSDLSVEDIKDFYPPGPDNSG